MLRITILHKNSIHPQKIFRIRQQYILDNILVHILVHCAMNSMQWPHAMHRKTTPYLNSTSTSNGGHNAVQIQFFTDLPPDIYCVNILYTVVLHRKTSVNYIVPTRLSIHCFPSQERPLNCLSNNCIHVF